MMRFSRRRAGYALLLLFVASTAGFMIGGSAVDAAPEGWIQAGSHPSQYDMGVDRNLIYQGKPCAFIKSKVERTDGFGTLMQTVNAEKYRGKRMRVSAHVRSDGVTDWAGLWMRVDSASTKKPLAFDNMENRAIKGSTDWKRYAVVLDVAPEAQAVAFGVLLAGKGNVFINNITLEPVDRSVPTTGMDISSQAEPTNLDFAK